MIPKSIYWIIILVGCILFLPFLGHTHLFDWDEINFAECAREMIIRHDYMQVTIDYKPFYEKPPLFFWLQAISMHLLGVNDYAARFPNAIVGIITLISIYRIGLYWSRPKVALWWVIFYLISWTPHIYFKSGIIDPVFNYFILLGFHFFALSLKGNRAASFLSGLTIGLAILTKGPVALLLFTLAVSIYLFSYQRRDIIRLIPRIIEFYVVCILVAGSWFLLDYMEHGSDYLHHFIRYQIELSNQDVATHGQPFYYHFIVLIIGCFPAAVFLFDRKAWTSPGESHNESLWWRLMKIMFWVVLIVFSLVKTKIIHYSSLCYFPLTFLAAEVVCHRTSPLLSLNKVLAYIFLLIGSLWSVALISLPIIGMNLSHWSALIKDPFIQEVIKWPMNWNVWESLPGLALFITVLYLFIKRRNLSFTSIGVFMLIQIFNIQFLIYHFLPKIENYTQEGAIQLYQDMANKPVDVQSLDYYSYAPFYYARRTSLSSQYNQKYYVCKTSDYNKKHQTDLQYLFIKSYKGFTLLKKR